MTIKNALSAAISCVTLMASVTALAANQAPSQMPPGDVPVAKAPVFVAIAFDDNDLPAGQQWVMDTWAGLSNPAGNGNLDNYDGQPLHATFFNTCNYIQSTSANGWNAGNVKNQWRAAMDAGHEMANHTIDHLWGGSWMDVNVWTAQIGGCNDIMAQPFNAAANPWAPSDDDGIGVERVEGFRTPYLDYNADLFSALMQMNFRYDASLAEGYHWEHDGTNFYWPYTLDNGAPGADLQASWGIKPQLGNYPGLWEVPIYAMIVPSDDKVAEYGLDYSLRDKIAGLLSYFDAASGKIESADYNLFYQLGLTGPEVLAIMKHSLDLRLEGNRAPLTFLAHSGNYDDLFDSWVPTTTTAAERRQVLEDFLAYALSKQEVRVVSHSELLDWMEAPTELGAEHCYRDDWAKGVSYETGNKVVFQGALWQAQWWSHNSSPKVEDWGPWNKVMDCEK